jgi:hypothetical protein
MSTRQTRRKCQCCKKFFSPDYRNRDHQHYCSEPSCRQASKRASQRRWLGQRKNRDYFRGSAHVRRVQDWRKAHPGYWKGCTSASDQSQTPEKQALNPEQKSCSVPGSPLRTLQDLCPPSSLIQDPAFLGLISLVTGSTLQDHIAATARQVLLRGQAIQGVNLPKASAPAYEKASAPSRSSAPGSKGL